MNEDYDLYGRSTSSRPDRDKRFRLSYQSTAAAYIHSTCILLISRCDQCFLAHMGMFFAGREPCPLDSASLHREPQPHEAELDVE